MTWARAYFSRGEKVLTDGKGKEAKAQFALALQHDPQLTQWIDKAWANAYVSRGEKLAR